MLAAEITNEVFRLHPDSLIHGKTKGGKVLPSQASEGSTFGQAELSRRVLSAGLPRDSISHVTHQRESVPNGGPSQIRINQSFIRSGLPVSLEK